MKKVLAIILAIALLCIIAVGTTLSYFTDTDADTNTMAVGKVTIVQNEKDRDDVDFVDAKLYPYTGTAGDEGKTTLYGTYKMFDTNKNAIDKIVTVTLGANSEKAYVRTIFAFEANGTANAVDSKIFLNYNANTAVGEWEQCKDAQGNPITYTKTSNGEETVYYLYSFTYVAAYEKNQTTEPSLLQFYLDSSAENEFSGGSYEILAVSQAVQAQGFTSADAALTAAFGEVNAANVATWFN